MRVTYLTGQSPTTITLGQLVFKGDKGDKGDIGDQGPQGEFSPEDQALIASAIAAADRADDADASAQQARDIAVPAAEAAVAAAARIDLGELDDAIASTSADRAQTAIDRAQVATDRQGSETNATRAETAANNAAINANVYPDVATGRAAVADGVQFQVLVGDEYVRYRRDSATTQTEVGRYPSAGGLAGSGYRAALKKNTRKLVEGTGTVSPSTYRSMTWQNGVSYQVEVIARKGERRFLNLFCNTGFIFNVTFDLDAGLASGTGGVIDAIGEGWFRCRVIGTATTTSSGNCQYRMFNNLGTSTYTGDGVSGLYLDAVSLKQSGSDVEIFPNTDITSAAWTKVGLSIQDGSVENIGDANLLRSTALAISGVMTGDKMVEAAGASVTPSLFRTTGTILLGATYEQKVVAKAGERRRLNLTCNGGFAHNCTFDLVNGTASGEFSSIEHLGEGWYLCRVSKVASSTTSGNCQIRIFPNVGAAPYAGDGTSGIYLNSASLLMDGEFERWTAADLFGGAGWSKTSATVLPDVEVYRTFQIGGQQGQGETYFQGKKWAALGTSITDQNQYVPVVAAALGLTAQNLGVSGGSIASGSHYGSLAIYNSIASIATDSDLVTIEAGTNDFGADNSDLGALGDTTTATFYGALYAAVVAIQARAPAAKIVFLTPYSGDARTATHRHFRVNSKGHTLLQFQTAVKEVAAFLGLPCIDVGQEAGLGYLTFGPYSGDGLHPNALGGSRFGRFVAAKLNEFAEAGMMAA